MVNASLLLSVLLHATSTPVEEDVVLLAEATAGITGTGALQATIETNHENIVIELFESEAPLAVASFVGLARGKRAFLDPSTKAWVKRPFYDRLTFHRVIPNFVIQGGCPIGSGLGDPGYAFRDEIVPSLHHDAAGVVATANKGPNTNGSQFYITDAATPHLEQRYTVFGRVVTGLETVHRIAHVKTVPQDKPETPVVMQRVTIARAGTRQSSDDDLAPPPDAVRSDSGLVWKTLKRGEGRSHPLRSETVAVNVRLWVDGKLIHDMRPMRFALTMVIPGFAEGVMGMVVGEQRRLWVPEHLAFKGSQPLKALVFDVDLVEVIDAPPGSGR